MLEHIRVVLVNTSHPGNIGSAARAMKTMGLSRLYLVSPNDFPSARATWMASGAADLLERAVVTSTLDEAIGDCELVIGSSARERRIPWPMLEPRACAQLAVATEAKGEVAILFGREAVGLSNEELQRCHYHVSIPGNPAYDVLNLAQAVQVISYEIWQEYLARKGEKLDRGPLLEMSFTPWDEPFASHEELEGFHTHCQRMLVDIGFLDPENPRQLLTRLRRLFNRARLDRMEVNILRGVFSAVQNITRSKNI